MPCFHPLKAYRSRELNPATGRYGVTFNATKALNNDNPIQLPCGRCSGCRLERSRQWAIRCMHEAQMHQDNAFLTMTFSKQYLPADFSVDVRDLQLFFKKLRKSLGSKKIRFFACGEYGDENQRPHYHALIFNHDFNDKVLYKIDERKNRHYTSDQFSKLWPYGRATLGDVTFESAAYVARYNMKKVTGENAGVHYLRQNPDTKFWHFVKPEFIVMSRRPGIASPWLEKFKTDVYPSDFIIARGMKMSPPRFYDQQLSEEELEPIKRRRIKTGLKHKADNTPDRLRVRETVHLAKVNQLKRSLQDEIQ